MKTLKKIGRALLVAAFWLGVWALAAYRFGKPLLFPSPLSVLKTLGELLQTKEFYLITANSIGNILLGTLTATLCAILLAALTSYIRFLRELIHPVMAVVKATPVASFIILMLLFLGPVKVPAFITFLIVLPIVWTNLDQGIQSIDPQLREVATMYRFSLVKRLRVLIFPSVKPYFLSACKTAIGLAWKAGVAAEVLALPKASVGYMIYNAKMYLEQVDLYAWTVAIIGFSVILEKLFLSILETGRKRNADSKEAL
jgi:NitT/TauT family transport system permease protein